MSTLTCCSTHFVHRYMLGLAGVPGIIQFCGFFFLPESPRWLVSKDRDEEARAVLVKIRGTDDVSKELDDIRMAIDNDKQSEQGKRIELIYQKVNRTTKQ